MLQVPARLRLTKSVWGGKELVKEFDSGKKIWVTYVVAIAPKVLGTRVTLVIVTRGHTIIVAGGHTVNCGATRKTEK